MSTSVSGRDADVVWYHPSVLKTRQPNLSRNDDVYKMLLAKNPTVARTHIHVSCEYVKVVYVLPELARNLPFG